MSLALTPAKTAVVTMGSPSRSPQKPQVAGGAPFGWAFFFGSAPFFGPAAAAWLCFSMA